MTFEEIKTQTEQLLEELKRSRAYNEATLSNLTIDSGAYVFYRGNKAMYVGIVGPHSKQNIQTRVKQHFYGKPPSAPLASLMTMEKLELSSVTRQQLSTQYLRQFETHQELVRKMKVQAIEIRCCVTLAVFEIYAAVQLGTPYNYFCTH